MATRGPAGSIGEAGNDGRRARAEALGEPDAGSGIRAPPRVFERGGAARSGGERGRMRRDATILRGFEMDEWTMAEVGTWGEIWISAVMKLGFLLIPLCERVSLINYSQTYTYRQNVIRMLFIT